MLFEKKKKKLQLVISIVSIVKKKRIYRIDQMIKIKRRKNRGRK